MNGFNIFTTEKGDCFHCHSLGLFTDNKFHNIGLDSEFTSINMGRYNVTLKQADMGLFKTPTLRNIQLTAPYMHDGRYLTLEQVVEHYNSGVKQSNTLDPIMTKPSKIYGLGLTPTEKQDLVAFLKTLTDTTFTKNPLLQNP
jgi:cytochrome c peroxidase